MSCYVMLCKKRPLSFIMFPRAPLKSWNLATFKSSKSCFNSQLVGVKPESYFVQLAMACAYFDGLCAKQLQHSSLHAKPLTTHEDPGGMFWSVNDMPVLGGFWTTMIVKQFTRRWPLLVVGELIAVYDSLRAPIRKPWELPNQTKLAREHTVGILQGSLQVRLCCFLVRFPSL